MVTQSVILRIVIPILIPILTHLILMRIRTQVMMKMMMETATQAGWMKAPYRVPTRDLALLQDGAVATPMAAPAPAAPEDATYPTRL